MFPQNLAVADPMRSHTAFIDDNNLSLVAKSGDQGGSVVRSSIASMPAGLTSSQIVGNQRKLKVFPQLLIYRSANGDDDFIVDNQRRTTFSILS